MLLYIRAYSVTGVSVYRIDLLAKARSNFVSPFVDSETQAEPSNNHTALCACGYTLDELAARANENEDDETDRIDIDSLSLDARGRRQLREADRHKAQYQRQGSSSVASTAESSSRRA